MGGHNDLLAGVVAGARGYSGGASVGDADCMARVVDIILTNCLGLIFIGSDDDSWVLPMAARILQALSGAGVGVLMFSQSFS
jgi:hypothetical protein